jgi:hypothetical protein
VEAVYDDLKATFTQDQLMHMKVSEIRKLFEWYGIEYPKGLSKQEVVESIFREQKQLQEVPMSVRVRRIKYGN